MSQLNPSTDDFRSEGEYSSEYGQEDDSLEEGEEPEGSDREPEIENDLDLGDLFDPRQAQKAKQWYLPDHMNGFVEQNFTQWVDDDTVKAEVTEQHPLPQHDRLKVLKLDEEMRDLIPKYSRLGSFLRTNSGAASSIRSWRPLALLQRLG